MQDMAVSELMGLKHDQLVLVHIIYAWRARNILPLFAPCEAHDASGAVITRDCVTSLHCVACSGAL